MLKFIYINGKKEVKGPALFIDRDGVINCRRPEDYVLNWSQFIFIPGIREALKQLSTLGLPMIVISNQAGVGKGLLKPDALEEITFELRRTLLTEGISIAAAYFCPHRRDENCVCRKPKPGLLYKAADDFNVDISRSIFIGDSDTDVQAARAVGCQPVLFGSGLSDSSRPTGWASELPTAHTATELFDVVVKCLQAGGHPASDDHVARSSGRQ